MFYNNVYNTYLHTYQNNTYNTYIHIPNNEYNINLYIYIYIYIYIFPPNMIKVIREFERIQKKICRHKMSIMFNEICINEEMLPIYIYIYIYIYICE